MQWSQSYDCGTVACFRLVFVTLAKVEVSGQCGWGTGNTRVRQAVEIARDHVPVPDPLDSCFVRWEDLKFQDSSIYFGTSATIRQGAPEPLPIFIGNAMTVAPVAGTKSRFVTFSKPGMPAAARTWWV